MFKSIKSDIYIFCGCVLLLTGGILLLFSKESHADVAQKQILTLEKIIELPSTPAVAAWNADGTKILVNIPYIYRKPYHSVVRIIDVNTGTIGKPIEALGSLWGAKLHWSPKGDYLLVNRTGGSILFSYPALKKLGVAQSSDTGAKGSSGRCNFIKSVAFTHDNKAIWVSCLGPGRSRVGKKNWVIAVKVSIPEMKIIKRVTAPQQSAAPFVGAGRISVQGKKVILDLMLDIPTLPLTYTVMRTLKKERYFASYDLEAGIAFYKPFKQADMGFKGSAGFSYSVLNHFLIANIIKMQNRKDILRKITTINPKTHKPITVFDVLSGLNSTRLIAPTLSKDERFLFSRFSRADKKTFLAIWNTKSLVLQQVLKVPKFKRLKLSPDGKRLAGLAKKKLYIYKISQ